MGIIKYEDIKEDEKWDKVSFNPLIIDLPEFSGVRFGWREMGNHLKEGWSPVNPIIFRKLPQKNGMIQWKDSVLCANSLPEESVVEDCVAWNDYFKIPNDVGGSRIPEEELEKILEKIEDSKPKPVSHRYSLPNEHRKRMDEYWENNKDTEILDKTIQLVEFAKKIEKLIDNEVIESKIDAGDAAIILRAVLEDRRAFWEDRSLFEKLSTSKRQEEYL